MSKLAPSKRRPKPSPTLSQSTFRPTIPFPFTSKPVQEMKTTHETNQNQGHLQIDAKFYPNLAQIISDSCDQNTRNVGKAGYVAEKITICPAIQKKYKNFLSPLAKLTSSTSLLRKKSKLNRHKIQSLCQKLSAFSKYRLLISNYKLQVLYSIQQIEQIKQLMKQQEKYLEDLKEEVRENREKKVRIMEEIKKIKENNCKIEIKIKGIEKQYENLQERKRNILYALEGQTKKKASLKQKFDSIISQQQKHLLLKKLTRQLFLNFVLIYQKRNILSLKLLKQPKQKNFTSPISAKTITKTPFSVPVSSPCPTQTQNNRVQHQRNPTILSNTMNFASPGGLGKQDLDEKQGKNSQQRQEWFPLHPTFSSKKQQENLLTKLPHCLLVLCQIFMAVRLKNVEKMYFNRVSYFCKQMDKILQFDQFSRMVLDFYNIQLSKAFQSTKPKSTQLLQFVPVNLNPFTLTIRLNSFCTFSPLFLKPTPFLPSHIDPSILSPYYKGQNQCKHIDDKPQTSSQSQMGNFQGNQVNENDRKMDCLGFIGRYFFCCVRVEKKETGQQGEDCQCCFWIQDQKGQNEENKKQQI